MSARSRALNELADHFIHLGSPDRITETVANLKIYTIQEGWEQAADMARRTAEENTWRHRIITWIHRRTHTGGW